MSDATAVADPEIQPEVSAPASDAPETTPETTPADAPETQPDTQGDAPPALEWDDTTVDTVWELGGDKLLESERGRTEVERRAQELADQRLAEIQGTPDHSAEFQQYQQQLEGARQSREQAVGQLAPLLQALTDGNEADPKQIASLTVRAVQAAQAEADAAIGTVHTQHRVNVDAVMHTLFDDKADLVIGKFKSGKPMTMADAYDNALRAYDSQLVAVDQQGQPDWKVRQNAGPELVKRAIHMARSAGMVEGHRFGMTAGEKKAEAASKAKGDATIGEIASRAAAKRLGQTPPVVAGRSANGTGSKAERNQRVAYGIDAAGNRVTDADRASFAEDYPG